MNVVMLVSACVLELMVWYLVTRYNLHMFQQNTYLAGEQFAWLRKNWMRQDILIVHLALAAWLALTRFWLAVLLFAAVTCFVLYYFDFLRSYLAKKPLVFTARVKRMLAADAVLSALCVACVALFTREAWLAWLALAATASLQMFVVPLANACMQPIERAINRRYLNEAKSLLASNPQLKIIGITGSFGKTSVKYYLNALLRERFSVLMTPGNFNTPLGVTITVRQSLRPTHEIFICEMGARYVGEIAEICELAHPSMGVITALGPQHLDTFGSVENIVKTKFELVDALPAGAPAFLNFDNELIRAKAATYEGKPGAPRVVAYGTGEGSGYWVSDVQLSATGTSFVVHAPDGDTGAFQTKLIGEHNVVNVCGAIAVAHELGMSMEELRVPVRKIQAPEHRLQMKPQAGATIIDDAYNSNPVGSRLAVETLGRMPGVRILVTPGMVELGSDQERYNYEFGTYMTGNCDHVVVVGSENRDAILRGLADSGFDQAHVRTFTKVDEAIAYAYSVRDEGHKFILLENDLPDIY